MDLLTVLFIIVIVLWQNKTFLTAIGIPVTWVYGFSMAADETVLSDMWVAGIAIGLLGVYFLYKLVMQGFGRSDL